MSAFDHTPWHWQVYRVWRQELSNIVHDKGVIIFFFVVCLAYPILYSLIYNTEVVRDNPIAVVDDCRTPLSRQLIRGLDATRDVRVVHYAASMDEARRLMHEHHCYGIVHIPADFSRQAGRGAQAHVELYCDMSVMMRYKAMLTAVTAVTQHMAGEKQSALIAPLLYNKGAIIESRHVAVGNTGMGIGSAILLFILPLVLQQSMLLGICMLHAGGIERRRAHGGVDPTDAHAGTLATVIGRTLSHLTAYVIPTLYVLIVTPFLFDFPQHADHLHLVALALPFLIAVSLMGQTIQAFVNERESTFLVVVFSSVVFVFLSGASWPRYLMSRFWHTVSDCVPSTWMSNAYVLMQGDGAALWHVSHHYAMLWLQSLVFLALAYAVERWVNRRRYRSWQQVSRGDNNALRQFDLVKNGIN